EYEVARVEDRLRRRSCAQLERGESHIGLEGRSRRVKSGERPVVERLVRGIVERVPVCRVDAVDEEVRVVAGFGYEGEYSPRGRLDRDERPAVLAESAVGGFLQVNVERERQVVAGHGRRARRELLHALAAHDASSR